MRSLCIGDIHGAYTALIQVLDRARFVDGEDQLIFMGDYVDGWPDSVAVIDFLTSLKGDHVFILGNHDTYLLPWLETGEKDTFWDQNRGVSTQQSYTRADLDADRKQNHIDFLKGLKHYHVDGENRGFVHGGYTAVKGLGHERDPENYLYNRDIAKFIANPAKTVPEYLKAHDEIYIGHTPTLNFGTDQPMHFQKRIWNTDTGAGWDGGRLSAIDIDTKEFWQSDRVDELY